jgi:DNA-binding response OmpR family regulator
MRSRIMVVDDDADSCAALSELLAVEGFEVVAYPGGDAALSAIRSGVVPDAVVADIRMPGLGGLGLLSALKQGWAETPVILVSAFPDESVWQEAIRRGAEDVFPKPIHGWALAATLRAVIAGRRTRASL